MNKTKVRAVVCLVAVSFSIGTLNPAWGKVSKSYSEAIKKTDISVNESMGKKNFMHLSDHIGPSTEFTAQQRAEIQKFIAGNLKASRLICTGVILPNQTSRMNQIVATRARLSCDLAKELSPSIKTSIRVKNTQRENLNGRVQLLLK